MSTASRGVGYERRERDTSDVAVPRHGQTALDDRRERLQRQWVISEQLHERERIDAALATDP